MDVIPAAYHVAIFAALVLLLLAVVIVTSLYFNSGKKNKFLEEELKKLSAENKVLVSLSSTDPLTGVKNRRAFDETLAGLLALLPSHLWDERSGRISGLGLMMIDVDHFKQINDTYGHLVGDRYLKEVATAIVNCFRTSDLIGRFGGEEFMVAIPGISVDEFKEKAEELRECISKALFKLEGAVVTVSIGALYTKHHQEAAALVTIADKALYEAKEAGRNRVISHVLD